MLFHTWFTLFTYVGWDDGDVFGDDDDDYIDEEEKEEFVKGVGLCN